MKAILRLLTLCLCLALCLSLAACGGSSGTTAEAPAAAEAGDTAPAAEPAGEGSSKVFVYGTDANSKTFDTAADLQTNSGNFLVHAVGETLWVCDADGNMTLKLAENVNYTPEALDVTVKQGVKFSNGHELSASDVLFTLNRYANTDRTASMYTALDIAAAELVDDYHLTVPMHYYDAALIDLLGNASSMILDEELGDYESWLIGTGPYMLKGDGVSDKSGWEESVQYILVRNPYYWGTAPYYDEFDVRFYSQESTRYADLQAGNLDAAYLTESTYIRNMNIGAVPDASLVSVSENSVYVFAMATTPLGAASDEPSPFADINVRKALAHCLNVESIIDNLGEGVYAVATSLVGENSWIYEELGPYEYDPELAAGYLAAAGYSVDNPLELTLYVESTAWNEALATAIQADAAKIGINIDLSGMGDFSTAVLPMLISNQVAMTFSQASNGSGNDPGNLLQQYGPESNNTMLKVTDEHLIDLFTRGQASTDRGERLGIYHEFMEGIIDQYLAIPLYVSTKNFGVNTAHTSFAAAIDSSNQVDPTLLTD